LSPIAVVDVPVDNEYSLPPRRQGCRADGDVVKQAEPYGAVGFGVMTGWPHGDEGHAFSLSLQRGDGF
jgi:hypothetical protein